MKKTIVITTINDLTKAVAKFREVAPEWNILLIGDKKSVPIKSSDELVRFISVEEQNELPLKLKEFLPFNHYVRKNLGYLYALMNGAVSIYDTDDDNIPYDDWAFPDFNNSARLVKNAKYVNAYSFFTEEHIWPRGFPLNEIAKSPQYDESNERVEVGVWQGLADLDPDVDAIFRLVMPAEITFNKSPPIVLDKSVYCPFNSQNTLWHRDMLPYAYLPATVTFRFTDILRGYVAQRCLWEHGKHLGFTAASVYQERNDHDLMKDFESEIPCYTQITNLVSCLDSLSLTNDPSDNLVKVYSELTNLGIVSKDELPMIKAWVADISRCL